MEEVDTPIVERLASLAFKGYYFLYIRHNIPLMLTILSFRRFPQGASMSTMGRGSAEPLGSPIAGMEACVMGKDARQLLRRTGRTDSP